MPVRQALRPCDFLQLPSIRLLKEDCGPTTSEQGGFCYLHTFLLLSLRVIPLLGGSQKP
jgi:hypothetical protein